MNDPYVRRAKVEGYRSRAAYKLLELAGSDRLFRPGLVVVDLGAAPGSWSQVAIEAVGEKGRLVAVDLLPMEDIRGVQFLQGDIRGAEVQQRLEEALAGCAVDLVLCDMAPNLTGVAATDQARSRELCEMALDFAAKHLKPGGNLVIKAFQGVGYREFLQAMRSHFREVASRKPGASRDRSAEMYLVGKGFRS